MVTFTRRLGIMTASSCLCHNRANRLNDILSVLQLSGLARGGHRLHQLRARGFVQLCDGRCGIAKLRMLRRDITSQLRTPRRHALWPLDEAPDLVELRIEESEDGDGAKLSLIEILVDQVQVLIAQEDPHIQLATTLS